MASSADWFAGGQFPSSGRSMWRWAGPPGGQDAAWDIESRHEIRWIWQEVCAGYWLSRRVIPDDGPRSIPHIKQIDLGPPTRFTVRLRPGQLACDVADIAPRLAAAYDVEQVRVHDLGHGWVSVGLVEELPAPLTVVDGGRPDPDARAS